MALGQLIIGASALRTIGGSLLGRKVRRGFSVGDDARSKGAVVLELDAIASETADYKATPTTNEVEDGADVSDHVTKAPEVGTFDCVVSNSPLGLGPFGNISTDPAFRSSDPADRRTRSARAFDFVSGLWEKGEPFDFVSGLKVYYNVVISSLTVSRTPQNGRDLRFSMTLQRIRIARSETVTVPEFKAFGPSAHSAASQVDTGKQVVKPVSGARTRTMLAYLTDEVERGGSSLGGLLGLGEAAP